MNVYVDDMRAPLGRMVMCHMIADSTEELLAMADRIGVQRRWIQHPDTPKEHFDIALSKRMLAVQHGAVEVDRKFMGERLARKVAPETTEPTEGWWRGANMRLYHWFREGRSLCKRWAKWNNDPFSIEAGLAEEPGPEDCVACWRKRKKELAA